MIDYSQQYNNNPQKSTVQSTYRPSTVATQTSAPPSQQPQRETYNNKQQDQNVYQQRPVQAYNPEYDEGLIAQVRFSFKSTTTQFLKILKTKPKGV